MTGRLYTIGFSGVTVTAAQDLISVEANGMPFEIVEAWLSQISNVSSAGILLLFKTFPTGTIGSGGSVITPQRNVPGDSVATVIGHVNDTALAQGTPIIWRTDAWNIVDPYLYTPPSQNDCVRVPGTGVVTLTMPTALTNPNNIVMSGGMLIRELV